MKALPKINILETVRDEMERRRGSWPAVCAEAGVEYWWWVKVAQGKVSAPSFTLVQRLYDYLQANAAHPGRRKPRQHAQEVEEGGA